MKPLIIFMFAFMIFGSTALYAQNNDEPKRQTYPLNESRTAVNRKIMETVKQNAPGNWKNAGFAYFLANPMNEMPYLPDSDLTGLKPYPVLELIAARDEYEPVSFLLCAERTMPGKLQIVPGDFRSEDGGVIPASEADIKMIKCWYKSGSAWYGMFVDPLRRRLIPELLLNDENLVYADPETQDNYLRMKGEDGSRYYEWASQSVHTVNWRCTEPDPKRIEDAETFQGVVLNKDELKQILVTFHVPRDAKPGLYNGKLTLSFSDGSQTQTIPVRLKVLPFVLPDPKTNYDLNKTFVVGFYGFATRGVTDKRILNCVRHNVKNPIGFPVLNLFDPEQTRKDAETAIRLGINTDILLAAGPSSGVTVSENPTRAQLAALKELERKMLAATALSKLCYGHTNFYCYGVDEGNADVLRAQQPAWSIVRNSGAKIMVTTYPRGEMMFNLDLVSLPEAPHPRFVRDMAEAIHKANPDSIVGWYSNPHCGPENPDFNRRFYGLIPYANNLDADLNYAMLNHNVKIWNEFGDTYESDRRNNSMLYPTKDSFVDTLEWEGVREGIDDIRYLTLLRQLCKQALASPDPAVHTLARKALSKLAYTDLMRRNPDTIRLEAVRNILILQKALSTKGQVKK